MCVVCVCVWVCVSHLPGTEEVNEELVLSRPHCTVVDDEQDTERVLLWIEAVYTACVYTACVSAENVCDVQFVITHARKRIACIIVLYTVDKNGKLFCGKLKTLNLCDKTVLGKSPHLKQCLRSTEAIGITLLPPCSLGWQQISSSGQPHTHTHRPSTITLAAHAR